MASLKTNSKQVQNKLDQHVLEYFTEDYGWTEEAKTPLENLKEQLKSFDYMPTTYKMGRYMAEGGSFLIYHQHIIDFLNSLGINEDKKEYTNAKSWELYQHLIGKTVERLTK